MYSIKTNDNLEQISKRLESSELDERYHTVKTIVEDIKNGGDKAVASYTQKFDGQEFDLSKAKPFQIEIRQQNLSEELCLALANAKNRIEKFHQEEFKNSKLGQGWSFMGDYQEKLGVKYTALDSVACYIPGGQAPLISTVLMTVIPAKVAGVKRIVVFSPPPINPAIIHACFLCGVDELYAVGGAQAIAVAAHGTESISSVNKVVGPGNIFVSLAKKYVFGKIGIDGIYGPSELAILAGKTAKPETIAYDLLSQLEHGSGLESVLLLSESQELIDKTKDKLSEILETSLKASLKSQQQVDTILNSLEKWSAFIAFNSLEEAANIINNYAPEHLELQLGADANKKILDLINNAGAIFIGTKSCESLGDYLAGPSHCLPTAASAKFSSGLQCQDFMKKISLVDFEASPDINKLIEDVALIARAEELEFHAAAMEQRKS